MDPMTIAITSTERPIPWYVLPPDVVVSLSSPNSRKGPTNDCFEFMAKTNRATIVAAAAHSIIVPARFGTRSLEPTKNTASHIDSVAKDSSSAGSAYDRPAMKAVATTVQTARYAQKMTKASSSAGVP